MMKLKKNRNKKSREKNPSQLGITQLTRHMRHEIRIKKTLRTKMQADPGQLDQPPLEITNQKEKRKK